MDLKERNRGATPELPEEVLRLFARLIARQIARPEPKEGDLACDSSIELMSAEECDPR